ncbi:hypothetical protein [Myroides injenensis]|uniref:hypothetical protein n=1 Tax=Myroides injenensis TaxID=1183151 RepID=UPI0002882B4F|nr:hypothetical protein [Myroides injenensis]
MEEKVLSDKIQRNYKKLKRIRLNRLLNLIFQFIILIALLIITVIEDNYGIENFEIRVGPPGSFYVYWFIGICGSALFIKYLIHFADYLPYLKKWQENLERNEFEKLKRRFEYQIKLNDCN